MSFIERSVAALLQSSRPSKACVLLGPRQAGKTTLLSMLSGRGSAAWYSGDDCASAAALLGLQASSDIRTLLLSADTVIIDEAQRIPGIGLLIKRLADADAWLEKPVRLFAAASSSLELSAGVRESALGRIEEICVWPLSTAELAGSSSWGTTLQNLGTRIVYGTYPEVCTHPEDAKKILINHCGAMLYKDLFDLSGIRFSIKFENLVRLLARSIGSVVTYEGLGRETGLAKATVMDYIRLLEECFIIKVCPSFSKNLGNEMKKGKKIYFCDTGIRNAVIRDFSPLSSRADAGALWENFFFMERVKYHSLQQDFSEIYFWKTTGHKPQTVDFIELTDQKMRAFDCRLSPKARAKSSEAFIKTYPDCPLEVVSPNDLMRLWQPKLPFN
ncbi:ATP-binding protein [Mesosutterella sp. AGMB02718]|uniref:ATP-binding protein n=1 Tax=Mesosutterella faecium TaxID=2925194 RepID=A0ABT7INW6_9BURK|nr:ATP-binding protein [Mesosutterella sp. AGMB02718]MDL2060069.1 ATP-binding protein [Mesosutterella sp. AGMB02718]